MLKRFLKNEDGASAVEFAVIALLLVILTFGVIDMGYALWQWNNAEKATQIGVRLAAVSTPIAPDLATFECGTTATTAGQPCTGGGTNFGTVSCTISACTGSYGFSQAEANRLLTRMRNIFPQMQGSNLIVEYQDLQLAFDGRGSPVGTVTVRIVGMNFEFIMLDALLGFNPIAMPEFAATLTTEDLNTAG